MDNHNTGKKCAVYLILVGLLVLAINLKINTGVDYGFKMGENEGVEAYTVTQFVSAFTGRYLHIDVFFDPVGYALIIAGFLMMGKSIFTQRAVIMSVTGMACKLLEMFLPLVFEAESLIMPMIIIYLLQILAVVVVMYSFAGMCTKKIDNYKYMQIGKDLKFGAELYGICLFISKVLYLFSRIQWYFANVLYHIVNVVGVAAVFYYVYKVFMYMRQIDMFEEEK